MGSLSTSCPYIDLRYHDLEPVVPMKVHGLTTFSKHQGDSPRLGPPVDRPHPLRGPVQYRSRARYSLNVGKP
eukprot:scaffold16740_cov47-Phaeocystis_antarctica.AAC.1